MTDALEPVQCSGKGRSRRSITFTFGIGYPKILFSCCICVHFENLVTDRTYFRVIDNST